MRQSWNLLTFLHWKYPASVVQSLIPAPLTLDLFDGEAWVGLVPFVLRGLRVDGMPFLPGFREFLETNVRTYVRDSDGEAGVWFFSLDAASLAAVLGARANFGLPYFWSQMRVSHRERSILYESRRRWPGRTAKCAVEIEPGETIAPEHLTAFDHYLTARFRLFAVRRGNLVAARVEHPPWPLKRARLARLEQNLMEAAGLPSPTGSPVIHYSDGVDVRVGAVQLQRLPRQSRSVRGVVGQTDFEDVVSHYRSTLRRSPRAHQTRSLKTGIQIASASWEEPTVLSPCSSFPGCVISYGPTADRWGCCLGDQRVPFPNRRAL